MGTDGIKPEILGKINIFDSEPEWCLPPKFWDRSGVFKGYTIYPLGARVDLPIRQCHISALHVISNGTGIGEKLDYCTGYARYDFKDQSYWSRHSWVVHQKDKVLLEATPNHFDQYFGVILTDIELEQFKEMMEYEERER